MNLVYSTQFKKDYKRVKKRNKDLYKLKTVIELIMTGQQLPQSYRDHQLTGNWKDHRDCHIEPDWLLIYRVDSDTLFLERTGSHSDLFK
ncbi:type II toxin-antitoxin system YafQ family toxin [Candidatus Dojkabacteria bacterium]|nr:type II toxin-antitoxin system YafQ family toxin [Candidatus Dojkabacteria bacterium]